MADFWLPPEFLTEDDILTDFKKPQTNILLANNTKMDSLFDFSSGFNSGSRLSFPDESMLSLESEEEFLAGLTRKMANSTLLDDLWKTEIHKGPKCPSPPLDRKAAEWEFLYAAAKEIVRVRRNEEANAYYRNRGLNPTLSPIESSPNIGFQLDQSVSYRQLQIAKFRQMKRDQLMKQQQAIAAEAQTLTWPYQKPQTRHVAQSKINYGQDANLSTLSWPTLQQSFQPHQRQTAASGMRAVFLGNTGSKRECAGTGVFLPRRAGDVTEPCRKSGCATVLLPDRVAQALNLNLEAMDETVMVRNNVPMCPQQKQNLRPTSAMAHADLRLPQEWTY